MKKLALKLKKNPPPLLTTMVDNVLAGDNVDAMNAMMKARIATASELGNPSAQRMTSPNPKTGTNPEGQGTHYMASMGNYAVPLLQDKGGEELEYNENPAPGKEDMRFESDQDARYFSEHYKEVAPMMKHVKMNTGGGLSRSEDRGSDEKPYPSVDKEDFAGGKRSYPIPTRADAVDALRLAGLHGRSDVKAKVYAKYPDLKKHDQGGGTDILSMMNVPIGMGSYLNGGGVEDLLPNTFVQANPLSTNYQGIATRQANEIQPGFGLTVGRTGIADRLMKDQGFTGLTGTANVNLPYSGGKPSVYGNLEFQGDKLELVPGYGTDLMTHANLGLGYDPNIGFNADFRGGADFQFRNMSATAYRNPDKWKQGALLGSIGPQIGAYYRSQQLQQPTGYQGDPNDAKAGIVYGGRGSIEYQPFRFPLRLSAEGSLMWNPGAGKTIGGQDDAGKIQGKWQPGLQVGAKLPLSAFSKPKKTTVRVPPVSPEDTAQNDWVRNAPSGESPNMGNTIGRMNRSIWRTDNE